MRSLVRFGLRVLTYSCVLLSLGAMRWRCGSSSAAASVPSTPYVKPVKPPKGITPNPLVSRGHAVTTNLSGSRPGNAVDGKYRGDTWLAGNDMTDEKPAWLSIDVGAGPTKLLLAWTASANFPHNETTYGGMGAYRIETSADSTDGKNGSWKVAQTVTGNGYRTREHAFDFTGQKWARLAITAKSPTTFKYGVQLDEVDLHDISAGSEDTWFFLGDSITAFAFDRGAKHAPSFAEVIAKKHPGYYPMQLNGGIGFEKSDDGLKRLPELIAAHPDVKYWGIMFGTNDAAGNSHPGPGFKMNLEAMVKLLKDAGRVPIFARIPFAVADHDFIPEYNEVVDEVTKKNGLTPGPNLYDHFKAAPGDLDDSGIHPNDKGIVFINKMWAEAVDSLYPP